MRLIVELLTKEKFVNITRAKDRIYICHSLSDREQRLLLAYLDYSNFYRELAHAESKMNRRRPILRRADLIEPSTSL